MSNSIFEGEKFNLKWVGLDEFVIESADGDLAVTFPDGPIKGLVLMMADEIRNERKRLMAAD